MYLYKSGYVKRKGVGHRWVRRDIGSESLGELLSNYDGFIFLTHPNYQGIQHLALSDIPDNLHPLRETRPIRQWLAELGNMGLPLQAGRVSYDEAFAHYEDAWRVGCSATPISKNYHPDQEGLDSDRPDLLVTHPGISPESFYKSCLVTVNGFLHYTGYSNDGLWVVDGASTGRIGNDNRMGLWQLGSLGELKSLRVKREHIVDDIKHPLSSKITLRIENTVDLENKSVFLVLGGIFQYSEHYVKQVGERLFEINMRDYPFPQHYFDLKETFDLSDMTRYHDKSSVNPNQIALEDLYSKESIKSFLTLSNTFFVIVDTPETFYSLEKLENTQLPGVVKSASLPHWPMIHRLGRFAEYWSRRDVSNVKFYYSDQYEDFYTFETTHWKDQQSIDNSRVPSLPCDYGNAYFLKMSSFV